MSPEALEATEVRRQTREAEQRQHVVLHATWMPSAGSTRQAETKEVTLSIDRGQTPDADDVLRIAEGATFHGSILLLPAAYRLIAGGHPGTAPDGPRTIPAHFLIKSGDRDFDHIALDRGELETLLAQQRPLAMDRARRLVAQERQGPAARLTPEVKIELFETRWRTEHICAQLRHIAAKLPSRAPMLMAGADRVALWLLRQDFQDLQGPIGSAFAPAIVQPRRPAPRSCPMIARGGAPAETTLSFLQVTSGRGRERTLVLDIGLLGTAVAGLPNPISQKEALGVFDRMTNRSLALAAERLQGRSLKRAAAPQPVSKERRRRRKDG